MKGCARLDFCLYILWVVCDWYLMDSNEATFNSHA